MSNTGFGWLNFKIGSLLAEKLANGELCDGGQYLISTCDPYVKLFVNDEEEFKTQPQLEKSGWTPFDQTYYSPKIPKNSTIRIEIWDDNSFEKNKNDNLLLDHSMDIDSLLNTPFIAKDFSVLLANSIWRDDFNNEHIFQL